MIYLPGRYSLAGDKPHKPTPKPHKSPRSHEVVTDNKCRGRDIYCHGGLQRQLLRLTKQQFLESKPNSMATACTVCLRRVVSLRSHGFGYSENSVWITLDPVVAATGFIVRAPLSQTVRATSSPAGLTEKSCICTIFRSEAREWGLAAVGLIP
jgi:hypothetical protein